MQLLRVDGSSVTYDALGRMIELSGGGSQKFYLPDGSQVLFQGQVARRAGLNLPGGARVNYDSTHGGLLNYAHADHLGSFRLITTPTRAFSSSQAYGPFGEPYAVSSASPDQSFTGQNSNFALDVYVFPARQYSDQGRWVSPDPAGLAAVDPTTPQSWNRYAYVVNSPTVYIDPFGLNHCAPIPGQQQNEGAACGGGIFSTLMTGSFSVTSYSGVDVSFTVIGSTQTTMLNMDEGGNIAAQSNPSDITSMSINSSSNDFSGTDWGWWSSLAQNFGRNLVLGVRKPGQSITACVNENISQTTGGKVNPQQLYGKGLLAAENLSLALAAVRVRAAGGYINGIQAGAIGVARFLGGGYGASRLAIGTLTGTGYTFAVAGAATVGITIGSLYNCLGPGHQ